VSVIVANIAPLAQIWLYLDLHPLGSGFVIVALGALASFGGIGLAARELLGTSVVGLAASLVVGTLLYGALLLRFRQLLALPVIRDALRFRNRRAAPSLGVSAG